MKQEQITYDEAQTEFAFWTARAESKQREIDSIIKRYGTGVRPSYVSADLAMAGMYRDEAKKQAEYYEYVVLHYENAADALAERIGD